MKKKPKIHVTACAGVEGPSLYIQHPDKWGIRVCGNKPWGGGRTIINFEVDPERMIQALRELGYLRKTKRKDLPDQTGGSEAKDGG